MFCEICGSPLSEGAKVCHVCGSEITGAEEATVETTDIRVQQENNKVQQGNHQPQQRNSGPQQQNSESEKTDEEVAEQDMAAEASDDVHIKWDLSGFPKPRKTEEVNFRWNLNGDDIGLTQVSDESAPDLTGELDRHFTFDKSIEDFQELLDRKYEKIKDYSKPTEKHPRIERMNLTDRLNLEEIQSKEVVSSSFNPKEGVPSSFDSEEEETPEFRLPGQERAETETVLKSMNVHKDQGNQDQENQVEIIAENDEIFIDEEEEEPEVIWVGKTAHEAAHGVARKTAHEAAREEARNQGLEALGQKEDMPSLDVEAPDMDADMPDMEAEVPEPGEKTSDLIAEKEDLSGGEEDISGSKDHISDKKEETLRPENAEVPTADSAEETPEKTEDTAEEDQELAPLWFESKEEEVEVRRRGYIGRVILVVIIAALLAEAIILSIQYFMPESNAAKKAGEINTAVIETLTEWKDKTVNFFKGSGEEEAEVPILPEEEEDDQPGLHEEEEDTDKEPDTTPAADKNALISAVSGLNKNIGKVKANDNLAWESGKDYAIVDIKNSKPIENNHWYTDANGKHFYYDREIVATLIDFDSKWVDYVNGGSDDVIDLTKKGSKAYNNVATFSKVGKVEQTFLLLQIGEIREGKQGFYAWTYEEIKEVQGGNTSIKKYNWIYQLEPVDGKMKITNYYRY